MIRLFTILFSLSFTNSLYSQPYLIRNNSWQQKIQKNYFLAPLFYGIKKTHIQLSNETSLKNELITKYGSRHSAYTQMLINGWNYFIIGMSDSAMIKFNQAYLIDSNDLETFFAVGSVITFLDGTPNFKLITHYKLNEKVSSTWDLTAFFGDPAFLNELKAIRKKESHKPYLSSLLADPQPPYFVDSSRYIILKIRSGDQEGFYKMGRPNGKWTDYYVGTDTVMRTYHITNGVESGEITGYYKNGRISAIFFKNASGEIDGDFKVYDYNGDLVRIEHWHKNNFNPQDSKVIREWEEDGKITTEVVNGELKEFIWKDGHKTAIK